MPISIPPFTNVPAPSDPVTSPWAQQLTQFAVDLIHVGASEPSSADAELWYDTDDPGVSYANAPRGWIGHAVQSGDQVTNTTATDLPGMSVGPFTISDTSRKILVTANAVAQQAGAAGYATLSIVATPSGGQSIQGLVQVGDQMPIFIQWVLTGVSGTFTIKVQASVSAGTCTWKSAAGLRTHLVVQDIGGG